MFEQWCAYLLWLFVVFGLVFWLKLPWLFWVCGSAFFAGGAAVRLPFRQGDDGMAFCCIVCSATCAVVVAAGWWTDLRDWAVRLARKAVGR